ncbi:hypothetical protein HPB50_028276 [Hyalomma asiaticum]|nr:hypothetical protein HPB50_028276 [Hyalomma asiaticum]
MPAATHIGYRAFSVLVERVSVLPLSSVMVFIGTEELDHMKGVVEGDQHSSLGHEICVARGIAELAEEKAKMIPTNFSDEQNVR